MALLFVDTTYDITLGLLSEKLEWLDLRSQSGQRASAILQSEVFELCRKAGTSPRELEAIITCAGPGFYTGLRLSEGFADIFKAFGTPCLSFYSYEIPGILGVTQGAWVTKAYRGEYFFHHWEGARSENRLIKTTELPAELAKLDHVYLHSEGAMDHPVAKKTLTLELLRERPAPIFSKILRDRPLRESFYFRAPEDEFKVSG